MPTRLVAFGIDQASRLARRQSNGGLVCPAEAGNDVQLGRLIDRLAGRKAPASSLFINHGEDSPLILHASNPELFDSVSNATNLGGIA